MGEIGKRPKATARRWRNIGAGRFGALYLVASVYFVISGTTRVILALIAIHQGQITASSLFAILSIGALYDVVTCVYLFAPFALYLLLLPRKLHASQGHRIFMILAYGATLFGLLFLAATEYFFFDEFNARFNFIAVEYLIYPHEVFVNIWQSYPVGKVLLATAAISVLATWKLWPRLRVSLDARSAFKHRLIPFGVYILLLVIFTAFVNIDSGRYSDNRVANELAQNGVYSFFNAALNSELDYPAYYLTLDDAEAKARLQKLIAQPNARFIEDADNPLARHIENGGLTKPLNVIVLLEESLGAEFIGVYGDTRNLTPNIDRIAHDSLVFTNVYATGTRTVRGMEAVSASFPPVPAESIVKRPRNESMFNWSGIMRDNGYAPTFIYGGYGAFDNMNYFFGHNGYRVVDRTDMDKPAFGNIWGVSDEDLFRNAFRVFDAQHGQGEKIFSIVMTTSNHKPFTFPAGVPGVKTEGGGREAGVRYADYAIGKFFGALDAKPYRDDTLVIIIGDHGARVYGNENIPLRSYELPLLIYAPKHFPPRTITTLASQLDLAPTVLGLLNVSYDSVFFGKDIFAGDARERFVLLNHNRDIALLTHGKLTELNFRKKSATFAYDKESNTQSKIDADDEQIKDAAAIFQTAYELYASRHYRLNPEHQQRDIAPTEQNKPPLDRAQRDDDGA